MRGLVFSSCIELNPPSSSAPLLRILMSQQTLPLVHCLSLGQEKVEWLHTYGRRVRADMKSEGDCALLPLLDGELNKWFKVSSPFVGQVYYVGS